MSLASHSNQSYTNDTIFLVFQLTLELKQVAGEVRKPFNFELHVHYVILLPLKRFVSAAANNFFHYLFNFVVNTARSYIVYLIKQKRFSFFLKTNRLFPFSASILLYLYAEHRLNPRCVHISLPEDCTCILVVVCDDSDIHRVATPKSPNLVLH